MVIPAGEQCHKKTEEYTEGVNSAGSGVCEVKSINHNCKLENSLL